LLFLSGVIIPVTLRFSNISLFLGGLFAILAFYTKQYGVLGFPVVLSYLFLFVSMRRALVHAGIFLGILFSSIWVVAEIMPCYFYNTTASMAFATSENNYGYSIIQLKLFFFRYLTGISILSILTCAVYLWQKRKSNFIEIRRNQISLNTSNIMKGLFPWQPNPYMALTVVFFLFLLLKLGGNEGTFMTYHFQLLAYSWIILVISWASKLKGLPIIQVSTLGYAVFAITSLITSTGTFKEENKAGWEKAIRLIRQHHHILNDQTLAAEMVYVDKRLYNSGLTEYFFRSTENKGFNRMFPFTQQLINQGNEFKNLVENNIKHQNFDLLMLAQPHWIIHNIPVEKYYSITDSLHLNMYHTSQDWMIYIWKPRKDSLNLEAN
jgi:hypothetical protein